jgi:hypothetical protein
MPPPVPRRCSGDRCSSSARKPVAQRITAAARKLPSASLTPSGSIREHLPPVQGAARGSRTQRGRPDKTRDRHHALRRESLADPFFDQGDGIMARLPVKLGVPPHRLPAGKPAGGGHLGYFVQQPDGGNSAAHHDDVLPAEFLGRHVVGHVQLPAPEAGLSRVDRPERPGPRAGGVDDRPRGPAARGCVDPKAPRRAVIFTGHRTDLHGPQDIQPEPALIVTEVA